MGWMTEWWQKHYVETSWKKHYGAALWSGILEWEWKCRSMQKHEMQKHEMQQLNMNN